MSPWSDYFAEQTHSFVRGLGLFLVGLRSALRARVWRACRRWIALIVAVEACTLSLAYVATACLSLVAYMLPSLAGPVRLTKGLISTALGLFPVLVLLLFRFRLSVAFEDLFMSSLRGHDTKLHEALVRTEREGVWRDVLLRLGKFVLVLELCFVLTFLVPVVGGALSSVVYALYSYGLNSLSPRALRRFAVRAGVVAIASLVPGMGPAVRATLRTTAIASGICTEFLEPYTSRVRYLYGDAPAESEQRPVASWAKSRLGVNASNRSLLAGFGLIPALTLSTPLVGSLSWFVGAATAAALASWLHAHRHHDPLRSVQLDAARAPPPPPAATQG